MLWRHVTRFAALRLGSRASDEPIPPVRSRYPRNPLRRLQWAGRGLGRAGFEGLDGGNGLFARPDRPYAPRPQAPLSVQAPTEGTLFPFLYEIPGYIGVTRVYAFWLELLPVVTLCVTSKNPFETGAKREREREM